MLARRTITQFLNKRSVRCFSSWGEYNLDWIAAELKTHFKQNEGEYDFPIPWLENAGKGRSLLVSPCIESSTAFVIKDALAQSDISVVGLVKPETMMSAVMAVCKLSGEEVSESLSGTDTKVVRTGNLVLQQREPAAIGANEKMSFDMIYDELPLDVHESNSTQAVATSVFGRCLNVGGILFVQTANAGNFKQKKILMKKMRDLYPESHFELLESRRLTWTRQWLYLKTQDTTMSE